MKQQGTIKKWWTGAGILASLLLFSPAVMGMPSVQEDAAGKYVQVTADSDDDAQEIIDGFGLAARNGVKRVKLAPGDFMLTTTQQTQTKAGTRWVHIPMISDKGSFDDFTLEGSVGEDGVPTSKLIAHNQPGDPTNAMGDLLWAQDCKNLTVKNLIFDRNPKYTVAGKILEVKTSDTEAKDNYIRVRYYDDDRNVPFTGMEFACANLFDLSACPNQGEDSENLDLSRAVLIDRSLTFATPATPMAKVEVEDAKKRIVKISYTGPNLNSDTDNFVRRCEAGQGISWAYSANGSLQVDFYMCDDLHLENLITYSASGMAIQTHTCKNVYGDRVQFYPEPGSKQFMVCGRDAWKVFKCSGVLENKNGWQEGVRMDGQNTHGIWLVNYEKTDPKTMQFLVPSGNGRGCYLTKGDRILFQKDGQKATVPVEKVEPDQPLPSFMTQNPDQGNTYYMWKVTFETELPEWIETIPQWQSTNGETIKYNKSQHYNTGMFAEVEGWNLEALLIENTTFKNIAGYGPMVKCDNAKITGCDFINMQNGAIFVGTEFPESGFPENVEISGNHFDNCGWVNRENYYYKSSEPKVSAAVVITPMVSYTGADGFKNGGEIKNITIEDNVFENCFTAVKATGVDRLTVTDNEIKSPKSNLFRDGYSICSSDDQEISQHGIVVSSSSRNVSLKGNLEPGKEQARPEPTQKPEKPKEITVVVNGKILFFDQPPVVVEGRTLVPLRAVFEALGAAVSWSEETQTVTAVKEETTIILTIGGGAFVSGVPTPLEVPAQLINDRTLVPLRFVSEALGAKVDWEEETQVVTVELQ